MEKIMMKELKLSIFNAIYYSAKYKLNDMELDSDCGLYFHNFSHFRLDCLSLGKFLTHCRLITPDFQNLIYSYIKQYNSLLKKFYGEIFEKDVV